MPSPATLAALRAFVEQREWDQFHTPENLAKSITIEAGELLECFQWGGEFDQTRVEEELADVVTYCVHLANRIGVDLDDIVLRKLESTRAKYPADQARGRMVKYTRLAAERHNDVDGESPPATIPDSLLEEVRYRSAGSIDQQVPDSPGLYSIKVRDIEALPEPFRSEARRRDDRLIYIGEAKISLQKRFLQEELRAHGHGTFFRSIGAILGYRPEIGSLSGKANRNNFVFVPQDQQAIIAWINSNLEVSWLTLEQGVHAAETELIRRHGPLLNVRGNPRRLTQLRTLRKACIDIATRPADDPDPS